MVLVSSLVSLLLSVSSFHSFVFRLPGTSQLSLSPSQFPFKAPLSARIPLIKPVGPTCSDSHVPGYIAHPKLKSAGKVFVVSVNDAFVYVSAPLSSPHFTCSKAHNPPSSSPTIPHLTEAQHERLGQISRCRQVLRNPLPRRRRRLLRPRLGRRVPCRTYARHQPKQALCHHDRGWEGQERVD